MRFGNSSLFSFLLLYCHFLLLSQTPTEDPFYYELLKEGKIAFNIGNYKKAIDDLKIAAFGFIDNRARLAECYVYITICFYNLKDFESARSYNNEVKSLGGSEVLKEANLPEEVEAKFLEISHYLSRLSSTPQVLSEKEDEIKVLQEAIKENPQDIKSYFKLSSLYLELSKFKEAIEIWERFLKVDNANPYPYLEIGKIYRLTKNYKKALQYLEKASALFSNPEPELHYELGVIYFELNNYEKAYEEFSIVRKINEKFKELPKYLKTLEEIFQMRKNEASDILKTAVEEKNPARKVEMLKKAKELDPLNRKIVSELVNGLVSMKKEKEAHGVLNEFLKKVPTDFELLIYDIELLIYLKDYISALLQIKNLENIDSSRIEIPYFRGKIYYFMKRYREAISELSKVTMRDKNYKDALYYYNLSLQKFSKK